MCYWHPCVSGSDVFSAEPTYDSGKGLSERAPPAELSSLTCLSAPDGTEDLAFVFRDGGLDGELLPVDLDGCGTDGPKGLAGCEWSARRATAKVIAPRVAKIAIAAKTVRTPPSCSAGPAAVYPMNAARFSVVVTAVITCGRMGAGVRRVTRVLTVAASNGVASPTRNSPLATASA